MNESKYVKLALRVEQEHILFCLLTNQLYTIRINLVVIIDICTRYNDYTYNNNTTDEFSISNILISTSAISMPQIYGQAEQNMQNSSNNRQQQTSSSSSSGSPVQEPTINDVRQARLALLQGVNASIEMLKKSQPTVSFNSNTTHIEQLLKTDQLKEAIVELENLQTEVIKAFGQEAANKQVVPQIQNLIGVLKKQS